MSNETQNSETKQLKKGLTVGGIVGGAWLGYGCLNDALDIPELPNKLGALKTKIELVCQNVPIVPGHTEPPQRPFGQPDAILPPGPPALTTTTTGTTTTTPPPTLPPSHSGTYDTVLNLPTLPLPMNQLPIEISSNLPLQQDAILPPDPPTLTPPIIGEMNGVAVMVGTAHLKLTTFAPTIVIEPAKLPSRELEVWEL